MAWLIVLPALSIVGTAAGFLLGKRASTWCPGCGRTTSDVESAPRPFALRSYDGLPSGGSNNGPGDLIAWGMALPDGSAITVDWRNGPSSAMSLCGSPDRAARLHDADLVWLPVNANGTSGH